MTKILKTEKDKEIFFNALENPKEPNENLKKAKERYDKLRGRVRQSKRST